jgi:hypothetical protein
MVTWGVEIAVGVRVPSGVGVRVARLVKVIASLAVGQKMKPSRVAATKAKFSSVRTIAKISQGQIL